MKKHGWKINKVLLFLATADILTWGLIAVVNVFAGIFISYKLDIDAIEIIGVGTAIFSLVSGIVLIPIGILIDKIKGLNDDMLFLFVGNTLIGIAFLLYPTIEAKEFYYVLQVLLGLGTGFRVIADDKMFTKFLDKGKEGFEFGAYDTISSIFTALVFILVGGIANINQEYFDAVMVVIGTTIIASGLLLLYLYKYVRREYK